MPREDLMLSSRTLVIHSTCKIFIRGQGWVVTQMVETLADKCEA
jgi:hypothetical protein